MKASRKAKSAFLTSLISLVLCFSMLLGTTYAWFTDTASTGVNQIMAGKLDVQLLDATTLASIEGGHLEFKKATGAPSTEKVLWEPGCTYELPAFIVKNNGDLTLKYKIVISGIKGSAKLNEAIEWTMTDTAADSYAFDGSQELVLGPNASSKAITIKGHMRDDAGNEYQGLSIDGIAITVYATQKDAEFDSLGNDYDAGATYPVEIIPAVVGQPLTAVEDAAGDVTYTYTNSDETFVATIPAGAVATGEAPKVTAKKTENPGNITINAATHDAVTYDIKIENASQISETNPAKVTLKVGKGLTIASLQHTHGTPATTTPLEKVNTAAELAVNKFFYNTTEGTITFMVGSFSDFTVVFETPVAVAGGVSYYNLQDALNVGGEVILLKDVYVVPEGEGTGLVPQMTVNQDTVLNLNGKTIGVVTPESEVSYTPAIMAVVDGATLTINGEGTITAEAGDNNSYGINVNGGHVIVNGGTHLGALTAFQVQEGSLTINNGFFDMAPTCKAAVPQYAKYVINCIDRNFQNGTATIQFNGGTIVNFDPSNNPEGADTTYVADGHGVIAEEHNGETWYKVIAGNFAKDEASLKAMLAAGGTVYLMNDITLTSPLSITEDTNLIGNGNDIAGLNTHYVTISPSANVTIENVSFSNPTNVKNNASCLYASKYASTMVIKDCTFKNTQWDSIQITPHNGADITIDGCTFVNETNNSHRYVHIEASDMGGNCNAKVTVTNNRFGTGEKVDNSIIDIDYIDYVNNLTVGGNTFADTTVADGDIFVCRTYPGDVWNYAEAYAAFIA